MLAQIGLTFLLYAWLTFARWRAVQRGDVDYSVVRARPRGAAHVARITRNLANQFELPVIFYAVVVLLIAPKVTTIDVSRPGCSSPAASSTRWCRP